MAMTPQSALALARERVRSTPLRILEELGPAARIELPWLREMMEYEDSELRALAREAIEEIEAAPAPGGAAPP